MDSRTPSLDDGGLVHFSGPRLIGYDQLPLTPIVVMPTKVFLRNRHPLFSLSIYSNTEQDVLRFHFPMLTIFGLTLLFFTNP